MYFKYIFYYGHYDTWIILIKTYCWQKSIMWKKNNTTRTQRKKILNTDGVNMQIP